MENYSFMTIIVIGPIAKDFIINGDLKLSKIGGPIYFQSFIFEKYYEDYLIIANCSDESLINKFPNIDKVRLILKDDTHCFVNYYPDCDNLDIRHQLSNFANIPITKEDLDEILSEVENIEAFIINPLNSFDFPKDTINYIKSFKKPIFISGQGFLRQALDKIDEIYYSISLKSNRDIEEILYGTDMLFLDEDESKIIFKNNNYSEFDISEIIITNASKGSRVISDREYDIQSVKNSNIVDSTGCGDIFMAAYISKKLTSKSLIESANFASKLASNKLSVSGPLNPNK